MHALLAVLLVLQAASVQAQAAVQLTKLVQILAAMAEASDSLAKLASFVNGLVERGDKTYSTASARATHSRLRDLSARLSHLIAVNQTNVFTSIERYLDAPSDYEWGLVTRELETVLRDVKDILIDVEAERSDFVLETTYLDIVRTLRTRGVVLERLISMPPPKTGDELAVLREIQGRYVILIANLEKATIALNAYLKTNPPK